MAVRWRVWIASVFTPIRLERTRRTGSPPEGMHGHDALRAATLHSADAIGLAGDIGSLEPGKLADLQILDANPLDDLENTALISYVMKNGRLYETPSLAEVWPRQRTLPTQWWWRVEPD